jgi:signal peptidase I
MDQRRNPETGEIEAGERPGSASEASANGAGLESGGKAKPDGGVPPSPENPNKPAQSKVAGEVVEWVKALAVAGLLVFVIRWFLVSPFIVDGPSMQPKFWNRERIIVNKIIYDIRDPKRGEVIVFHVPEEGRDFIKRVIGVAGDTVKVEGDTIKINGKTVEQAYLKKAYEEAHAAGVDYNQDTRGDKSHNFPNNEFPDGKVPEGTLFVMGDNRSNSEDSRMIGFVPLDRVVGRSDLVYWPIRDFHFISH